jgi:uncharacterized cupredoxin-like copper-binding protein
VTRKLLVLIAIAIPLTIAACGSDSSTSTSASSDTTATASTTESSTTASGGGGSETVKIAETEYKLNPADPTVKAGSVTFDVSNDGAQLHNLNIEGNGIEEVSTDDLQAGDSGQVTVDLPAGTYEMYCSIDGHRGLGMEGSITVQ